MPGMFWCKNMWGVPAMVRRCGVASVVMCAFGPIYSNVFVMSLFCSHVETLKGILQIAISYFGQISQPVCVLSHLPSPPPPPPPPPLPFPPPPQPSSLVSSTQQRPIEAVISGCTNVVVLHMKENQGHHVEIIHACLFFFFFFCCSVLCASLWGADLLSNHTVV